MLTTAVRCALARGRETFLGKQAVADGRLMAPSSASQTSHSGPRIGVLRYFLFSLSLQTWDRNDCTGNTIVLNWPEITPIADEKPFLTIVINLCDATGVRRPVVDVNLHPLSIDWLIALYQEVLGGICAYDVLSGILKSI